MNSFVLPPMPQHLRRPGRSCRIRPASLKVPPPAAGTGVEVPSCGKSQSPSSISNWVAVRATWKRRTRLPKLSGNLWPSACGGSMVPSWLRAVRKCWPASGFRWLTRIRPSAPFAPPYWWLTTPGPSTRPMPASCPGESIWATLHTGEAVAEDTDDPENSVTVVGETRTMAVRLDGVGEPGSVVISAVTRQQSGVFFETVALGTQRIRGVAQPVELFRVVKEAASRNRDTNWSIRATSRHSSAGIRN